jgi:tetratricopeptide (TPR) repeat protein
MSRSFALAFLLVLARLACPLVAAEDAETRSVAGALEEVRADLQAARLDRAIAALDVLAARSDLSPAERVETLALRAQAKEATGALDGVEEDYRRILALDPGFEPDPASTGKRARERFEKARAALVGTLEIAVDPADAAILVDGRALVPGADGRTRVLAGNRSVRVERRGFDPAELAVEVPPGGSVPLRVDLVPNARRLVVRTEPEGVEVAIDEVVVGATARPDDPDPVVRATRPAELVLEAVPAGEHTLTLSRPCFRTVRVREIVTVDVLDRSAKVLGPVILQAARTPLGFRERPPIGELRVDGERVADLPPKGPVEVCAGVRRIEVRSGGRTIWAETVEVPIGDPLTLDVRPRPNAVLVGADRWPAELASLEGAWSTIAAVEVPAGADLTTREGWARVEIPGEADLAVAVLPRTGPAEADRFALRSPLLGTVVPFGIPPDPSRPRWTRADLGLQAVDAADGGLVVVEVRPSGPASRASIAPGDRLRTLSGVAVPDRAAWTLETSSIAAGGEVSVEFERDGARRTASIAVEEAFRAGLVPLDPLRRSVHAAWAAAVGAGGGTEAAAAWIDLGVLLEEEGRAAPALAALRRSVWPARRGIGSGTVDYLFGRILDAMGRDDEAREALARAAAGDARFHDDDGPEVAPAAADRLADLGVSQ